MIYTRKQRADSTPWIEKAETDDTPKRISRVIGTTTVVIAEIVITIEENFDDRNRGMPCRTDIVSMLVLPLGISERLKKVQNSQVGHWELNIC